MRIVRSEFCVLGEARCCCAAASKGHPELPRVRETRLRSSMRITMSSRTSWRRSSTAVQCASWHSRRFCPRQAIPACNSIIPGSWPSCRPWSASSTSRRRTHFRRDLCRHSGRSPTHPPNDYGPDSLRYELSKLRAKGRVDKLPHSRRYRRLREICSVRCTHLRCAEQVPWILPLSTPSSVPSAMETVAADNSVSVPFTVLSSVLTDYSRLDENSTHPERRTSMSMTCRGLR